MKTLNRWPAWRVALVCALWLVGFPVAYTTVRQWWALRVANAQPCSPNSLCMTYLSVEISPSAIEGWLVFVAAVGVPLLFCLRWHRMKREGIGATLRNRVHNG